MKILYIATIVCVFSCIDVFSLSIDTVAGNIVAEKVSYCNKVPKTNEQEKKMSFIVI